MDKKTPETIKLQLEELKLIYENLQNALSAQKNTFHIYTLITTAVIAALGAALSSEKIFCESSLLRIGFIPIVLCVVFPLISYCFCGIWLGEVKRMLRSGNYIDYKSKLMREKYHYDIWNFENYNKSLGQIKVPYVLHLLYFIGSAIVSLIVGIVYSEYINLNLNIAIAEIILYLFNGSAVIFCVLYCVNILNGTKEYNMPTITELNTRQSKYAICIPVVNEGIRLKKQLLEMKRLHIYEQADIIICDGNSVDGSTDPDFLREAKVFALIQCPRAHQSEQLIEGFKFALEYAYEGVITIDGNNKDSVSTIPLFISKIQEGYGFVQGSRYIKGGVAANTPLIRTFAIKFHVHFMNKITNGNFTDTTNGFRAFHSMVLLGHYSQLFNERTYSSHEIAYYLFVIAAKYKHTEVAVSRKYPIKGRATKIVPIIGHLELLWILIKLRMHKDSNQVQELP